MPKQPKSQKSTKAPAAAEAKAQSERNIATEDSTPVPEPAIKAPAKAGKRSPKATAAAAEKVARQQRKSKSSLLPSADKRPTKKPTRSKLERSGKKFRKAAESIDKTELYSLSEALKLAVKTSPVKFDATVEIHLNLGVDPKQADQFVRDIVALPAGTGKLQRVAVLAEADDAISALKAGADIAGSEELLDQIAKNNINFDILIATPPMMAKLSKYARVLGPRGLMPNPKSGTVTTNVAQAVKQTKAGRVEYRVDSTGIVHLGFGKVSFGSDKLLQNAQAVLASVRSAKPASLKGPYIKSMYITTSMGPSIKTEAPS